MADARWPWPTAGQDARLLLVCCTRHASTARLMHASRGAMVNRRSEYQARAAHASLHEATELLPKHARLGRYVRMTRWIMNSWTRGNFVFILLGPCSRRSSGGLTTNGLWGIAYLGLGLCLGWALGARTPRPSPRAGPPSDANEVVYRKPVRM